MTPPAPAAGSRLSRGLIGLMAAALLVLHAAHYWPDYTDDAFISFRYARNLGRGLGMVWNPGEHLEGLTNLGWAILLSPFHDTDMLWWAKILGLAAGIAVIPVLMSWGRRVGLGLAGTLAMLGTLVLAPWFPTWCVMGLAPTAAALLMTIAWTRYQHEADSQRGPLLSGAAMGLAPFLRPEAAVVPVLVGLWHLRRRGGWSRRIALSVVMVLLGALTLVVLKMDWFGELLPNTWYVKMAGGPLDRGWAYLHGWLTVPAPWHSILALLALGWALVAGLWRSHRAGLPALLVITWAAIVLRENGDFMVNLRLLVPVWPALAAVIGLGVDALGRRWPHSDTLASTLVLLSLLPQARLGTVAELNSADVSPQPVAKSTSLFTPWANPAVGPTWQGADPFAATWVLANAAPNAVVAFTDIGLLGWTVPVDVVDLLGLTDRTLAGRDGSRWPQQWDYLKNHVDYAIIDVDTTTWTRFRDAMAADHWRVWGRCGADLVMVNSRHALGLPDQAEWGRRIDDLLRRNPRMTNLHRSFARELARAGAPLALAERLLDESPRLSPAEAATTRCDIGDGCDFDVGHCGVASPFTPGERYSSPEQWPAGVARTGSAPRDPEQKPGFSATAGGPAELGGISNPTACSSSARAAEEAWELCAQAFATDPEGGRAKHLARRAARRATATPRHAVDSARAAQRAAHQAPPDHPGIRLADQAWARSLAAWDACRRGSE